MTIRPALLLFLAVWLGLVATATPSRAAEAASDSILQQELKQQQIKTTTRRVGDQLEAIIAEFDRNGIAGEDVKVLRAIRSVLGYLTEKDMEKVIAFLQQARGTDDANVANRQATEAYAGQKAIVVQLQQLVLEYQRQQALYEISLRLKELATRQSANMWLGVSLSKSIGDKATFSTFDENQKISLRFQQSEQNPLKEETAAILRKLEKLSQEITDGPTAERPKAAMQQAREGGLMPALDTAANELRDESLRLHSAIGNEKKARDQMREIARLLILSQDAADAIKQAMLELDRAIDAQKKVTTDTEQTKKREDADRRATEQAAVVDDTDLIRKDIDSLAPIASEHLRAATDKMQDARASLEKSDDPKKRIEKALPRQEEAVTQMKEARHALEEQLAKLEELSQKPENNLAALKELKEEVGDLIKKEEGLKEETAATTDKPALQAKAPRQGELKDKAQELQAKAAAPSPQAASSLGEAASQMQKAQNTLIQQKNETAAQQAAIEALQKADQQLAQDIADLEKAEKELAQVEEMLKKLVAIIEEQQGVQFATAKQAVQPQPEAGPLKQLSARQDKLGQDTGALQKESGELVSAGSPYLASASNHMAEARTELDKTAPKTSQPRQTEALTDLYLAKREFEKKINELRDKLGLPPGESTDSLADAQKRIEEAQKEIAKALEQLQQAPPGAIEALQKQQQDIAKALHEMKQDAPESRQLAKAEQSAVEAAQLLDRSNLREAIRSMDAALDAMRQEATKQNKGQPDAAEQAQEKSDEAPPKQQMNNGNYSLGFWAAVTVQTPGAPELTLKPSGANLATLAWASDAPGYVLQSSPTLAPPAWTNAPGGTGNSVSLPASRLEPFYRLVKP